MFLNVLLVNVSRCTILMINFCVCLGEFQRSNAVATKFSSWKIGVCKYFQNVRFHKKNGPLKPLVIAKIRHHQCKNCSFLLPRYWADLFVVNFEILWKKKIFFTLKDHKAVEEDKNYSTWVSTKTRSMVVARSNLVFLHKRNFQDYVSNTSSSLPSPASYPICRHRRRSAQWLTTQRWPHSSLMTPLTYVMKGFKAKSHYVTDPKVIGWALKRLFKTNFTNSVVRPYQNLVANPALLFLTSNVNLAYFLRSW